MKFTKKEEIEQVQKELKLFLLKNDTNFRQVCQKHGLAYMSQYNKIFKKTGSLNRDYVEYIIKLVSSECSLVEVDKKYVIR